MTYSLEWITGPLFLDQIAAVQRDDNTDGPSLSPEALLDGDEQFEEATSYSIVSRRPIVMDIHLVPLDPGKPSELLLSRLDVASGRAKIQVRTEIPPGWYRLEIHFWDEGTHTSYKGRTDNVKQEQNEVWNLHTSSLITSPGHAKPINPNAMPAREVGIWRGKEAIEVTTLIPEFKEWNEFVETVSRETRQDRWSLREFTGLDSAAASAQRRREQREATLEEHRSEEEFRMPKTLVDSSGLQNQMKSLVLRLWGKSKSAALPMSPSFERTNFAQESFRFKEAMVIMANREGTPDFQEDELELMEEEEKEEEAREHRPSLQKVAWSRAMGELDSLMTIWSKTHVDDDGLDQNESYGPPPTSLLDLQIRVENGKDAMEGLPMTWRANRDRTASWQTAASLIRDDVLLAVELIKAPGVTNTVTTDGSARMKTRAEFIKGSLQQERLALLTDRVPASWEAVVVRMPTWILPGTYQLRLKGVSNQGVQWADVSQPFAVQSDPYLYY
ncbi:hypothetical protein BGX26_004488 [Mortierella sp. AD094]|nr:hypothetical protein BGX26_004488 [Mortierella sp. AD094]